MELGKILWKCQFLKYKRTNVEIWSVIPPSSHSRDRGIQDIITAASVSLILQAVSDMWQYLVAASKSLGGKIDIISPLTNIKDVLSLAGKVNQELNQPRRKMIIPYLPTQFTKLADFSDDSKKNFFGDSIADPVESLQKEIKQNPW